MHKYMLNIYKLLFKSSSKHPCLYYYLIRDVTQTIKYLKCTVFHYFFRIKKEGEEMNERKVRQRELQGEGKLKVGL